MEGFMQRVISVFSLHLCEQQTTQLISTCLASTINLCPYHSEHWCHQQHGIIHNKTILSVAIIILNDITIRVGKYPLHTARTPLTKCTKSLSDHPLRPLVCKLRMMDLLTSALQSASLVAILAKGACSVMALLLRPLTRGTLEMR